ncbi:MAG: hypothetical protein WCV68_03920 [Candidatus Paceibacterota bacterium]|jgi:hypothetical protein
MKYAELDLGTIEAIANKLGGMDGIRRFLRGELTVSEPTCRFREKDGVIYLTVTSDGTTGEDWIKILGEENLSKYVKDVLRSEDFQPTTGVVYEIAILKGLLFNDSDRITSKIRANAEGRGWTKPNAEVACLIRKNFSNEEIEAMGLTWIITMHEPIKDSVGSPSLLSASRRGDGRRLVAGYGSPDGGWDGGRGFAFVLSQVSVL